jgi:hypothetical protein
MPAAAINAASIGAKKSLRFMSIPIFIDESTTPARVGGALLQASYMPAPGTVIAVTCSHKQKRRRCLAGVLHLEGEEADQRSL